MRTTNAISIRVVLCMATAMPFLAFFSMRPSLGGETSRPIASMTPDERMHLPDNTMVKLEFGRTVSLGTLRTEHRARLDRFSRAAGLGQMVAGKLAMQRPKPLQPRPGANEKGRSSTGPARQGGAVSGGVTQSPNLAMASLRKVPFRLERYWKYPKDYMDFCNAADPTVCLYFPAGTTFLNMSGGAADIDPLITDKSVCEYDGGYIEGAWCRFDYPLKDGTNFKPTGPVTTAASCDPPSKYVFDPKGAIQATYTAPVPYGKTFVTPGTPVTCVVQVFVD